MQRKIFLPFATLCNLSCSTHRRKLRVESREKVVDLQSGEALIGASVMVVGSSFGANF